ncbi:Hypothetical protein D9617_8g051090 [Elsinoe fawcettii]|nr:Hypothetical protein D9617_8g051090 [Elsinoe fawcettii]
MPSHHPPHHRHRTASSTRQRSHHPRPLINFTIPSIYDDTVLDCRIYHPPHSYYCHDSASTSPGPTSTIAPSTHNSVKAAVLAHPYAPLGGSYDDPIVLSCCETLLAHSYIVATFNFRGAGGSKGKTSWTSKAEVKDYESVIGLVYHYLVALVRGREDHPKSSTVSSVQPDPSSFATGTPTHSEAAPPPQHTLGPISNTIIDLILGGYSYGTHITSHLPPLHSILTLFSSPLTGSAASEILLRASHLADETLHAEAAQASQVESEKRRGRGTLSPFDALGSMVIGGEETPASSRRRSQEHGARMSLEGARRSMERVPMRVRRVVGRMGSGRDESHGGEVGKDGDREEGEVEMGSREGEDRGKGEGQMRVRARYLLVSPLLPPLSGLLSMSFSGMMPGRLEGWLHGNGAKGEESGKAFTTNPTLAIFGSEDGFTSGSRLVSWAERMQREAAAHNYGSEDSTKKSGFEWLLVEDAGHFWREEGVEDVMKERIGTWVSRLDH